MNRDPIYRTLYSLAVGFSLVGFLVLVTTIVVRLTVGGDETPNLDLVAAMFVSLGFALEVATAMYRRSTTKREKS